MHLHVGHGTGALSLSAYGRLPRSFDAKGEPREAMESIERRLNSVMARNTNCGYRSRGTGLTDITLPVSRDRAAAFSYLARGVRPLAAPTCD